MTFDVDILIAEASSPSGLNAYVSNYLKHYANARIVALDPYLHSALLNGGFEADYVWHLLDDSQVQEEYRRARAFCRRLNETLSVDQRNLFRQFDLLDLNLSDIAYYAARYYYSVELLARHMCRQGTYSRLLMVTSNPSFTNAQVQGISYNVRHLDHLPLFKKARKWLGGLLRDWHRGDGTVERAPLWHDGLPAKSAKRVLFVVTASDTLMDEMVVPPIVRCIREESLLDPLVVTSSKTGANHLEQGNVNALYPSKDLTDQTYPVAVEISSRLKLECKRLLRKCTPGTSEYFTICFCLDHVNNYVTLACRAVAFLEEVFKRFCPDVVVTIPESTMFAKTGALLAKRNHIPSLSFYQLVGTHSWYEDSYADRILLYGSHGYDMMIRNGFPPGRLAVVGNPRYDDWLMADAHADRETICSKFQIPCDRKIMTIASHLAWRGTRSWVEAVARIFAEHQREGRYALIVKPHPGDALEDYMAILSVTGRSDVHLADRNFDIRVLINASDVVMTDVSTVGVEAIVLGKALICLDLTDSPQHVLRYDEEGGAILVTRADRIWDTIQDVLYDEATKEKLACERRRGIDRFALKNDGRSSARFLSAIHQMINQAS
jgi:hypothetical protein